MKITPEDMQAIRDVWFDPEVPFRIRVEEESDTALALILVGIWDRGYQQALSDRDDVYMHEPCPYETLPHTREWCGYAGCRES